MHAIQFETYGPAEVLRLVEIASPVAGRDQLLIRVGAAAVNPADPKWRSGMLRDIAPVRFPHVLGYDIAGTVAALGEGVAGPAIGTRVFAFLSPTDKGGYADYAVVPAGDAVAIPAGLDDATAAAIPTAGLTGVQMIEEHIRPAAGETVLITGATGAVGRFATWAALRLGARVVAAVRPSQIDEARALGAAEVIRLGAEAWAGAPFDHLADTVGGPGVAALCHHVTPAGRIRTAATTPIDPAGLPSVPVFVIVHNDTARLAELANAVVSGALTVPIARRLPLAEAAEAHRLVERGGIGGKVILEM